MRLRLQLTWHMEVVEGLLDTLRVLVASGADEGVADTLYTLQAELVGKTSFASELC